ncbi:hypothetical protein LPJ53_001012 [Coemansia erecta]|uniref:SH3 domain-containing protein n=1 Tax=Coemansia erecta TaxID=147472 RepID=A0A9W7Y6A3_9FUNG|nr:hypothetical protein LPJ53_001012 [Coemansia erecta]
MIAPEGIRDGKYYAEALYTFAGEGVEDLPFKKGDLIEVLDCADANWWRGKNTGTDEDGLFPACLVKFTDAPVAQQAMQTAERLARLSDVLTPAHVKQNQQQNSGDNKGSDPHDANSIESLLLNLANNEMQVQQQKIQAHMPQKTTRMKLLYEDHTRPDSAGRSSSLSSYADSAQNPPAASGRPPIPQSRPAKQIPVPPSQQQQQQQQSKAKHQKNSSLDMSLSQIGLWTPRATASSAVSNYSTSSFASSIESMREATLRTEASTQNRSSGSMLFGPRGMPAPPTSRSSSRVNDSARSEHSTLRSPFTTVSSHGGFSPGSSQSFASLYSQNDAGGTAARSARVAHEAAISEARQMLDGIPSPVEQASTVAHEAEYLFDDDDDDDDGGYAEPVRGDKLHQMISPASENSGRFAYYASTVSSRVSSIAESTGSKHRPSAPPTANASMVSDTSSAGLAGHESSIGDLAQLHRSWYSSTDSINGLNGGGGGGRTRSSTIDEDEDGREDAYAPRVAKNKTRRRPHSGTMSKSVAEDSAVGIAKSSAAEQGQYAGNYDTRYDVAADFQRLLNISGSTQNMYASGVADSRATSSLAEVSSVASSYQPLHPHQQQLEQQQQQQQPMYVSRNGSIGGYVTPVQMGYANVAPVSQGYVQAVYSGVDANGRPYSAYQQYPQMVAAPQQHYQQVPVAMNGQVQAGYYDSGTILPQQQQQFQQQQQLQQQQLQQRPMSMATTQYGIAMQPMPPPATPDFASRPRSRTTGAPTAAPAAPVPAQPASSMANGSVPNGSGLRPVSSANGLQQSNAGAAGLAIPNRQEQFGGPQRPASYAGPSSLPTGAGGRPSSSMAPSSPLPARASTPTGFGTMASTAASTFARGSGSMSPFPSNVGPSQPATYSAAPVAMEQPKDMFVGDLDPRLVQKLPENVTPINYVKMARPVFKFGGHVSQPETVNWSKVDRQMTMIKSVSVKLTVEVLATMHVGRPFNKPVERVRAAFFWIASNITYDSSAAESNEEFEQQETPNYVLQRRRSRGPGYAYLFDAMMHALGIECTTVRGYLRQPLDSYQGAVLPADNHVWNAVCLDGEFRMVDTACAAKSHPLNAESKVDPWFFLASPKDLIFTHFPLAALDQFVDPVVPLPVFWMLPYVRPSYFQSKVKLLNLPHVPRIELRDDKVVPLVMCVRDATQAVFAEVELHDPNGSGRIVARQPLLAQCMDYRGKRMVKILVAVRSADTRGLVKIYCGTRVPLQPKRADEAAESPARAQKKVLGFLNKDKRPSAHDYSRIKDVDEDGSIKTVATAKTYPLACVLPVVHRGRNNAPVFVQVNAAIPNEFYIKEPTDGQFHLGESVNFHLLPVGDERLFHLQLRSPSGHQFKFVYQPADQGYILRHSVKERGAWIIVYHTDSDGWLPIASYNCI